MKFITEEEENEVVLLVSIQNNTHSFTTISCKNIVITILLHTD